MVSIKETVHTKTANLRLAVKVTFFEPKDTMACNLPKIRDIPGKPDP